MERRTLSATRAKRRSVIWQTSMSILRRTRANDRTCARFATNVSRSLATWTHTIYCTRERSRTGARSARSGSPRRWTLITILGFTWANDRLNATFAAKVSISPQTSFATQAHERETAHWRKWTAYSLEHQVQVKSASLPRGVTYRFERLRCRRSILLNKFTIFL